GAAAVAAAGGCLLWRSAVRGSSRVALVAVLLFLPVTLYSEANPVLNTQRSVYPAGWSSPQTVARANHIDSLAYDLAHYDVIGLYVPQWFLPNTRIELFNSAHRVSPSRYVLSGGAWGSRRASRGARVLWRDQGRDQVIWQAGRAR